MTLAASATASPLQYQPIPGVSAEPIVEGAGIKSAQELEAFLDGVMAVHLLTHHIAGAALSVVKDGKLLFAKGYGYADVEKKTPVDGHQTLFRPGSTAKLFTWTAVLQLAEQGKLDLDADVNTYLKTFQIPATFPQPVTLRHILTHSAGFEDSNLGHLMTRDAGALVPLEQHLAAHRPARVRPPARDGSDGASASYSNWATALAGHIVSNVSGMPFDDYIERHIFQPLGMTRSTFREPLPPELAAHMSSGYAWQTGKFQPRGFEYIHNYGPAGSLTSTAADMARFMIAHLNNGSGILRNDTARMMHSRQTGANPHLTGTGLGFYEVRANGRRLISHNGGTPAFNTDLWLLPEENLGIFVTYNTPAKTARAELLRAFVDRYYPARVPAIKPPDGFAARAAQYTGAYRSHRYAHTTLEKIAQLGGDIQVSAAGDALLISNFGPETSRWIEVAPQVFRHSERDVTLGFVADGEGHITHLLPGPFAAAKKLRLFETAKFHQILLALVLLMFVVAIVSAVRNRKADRALSARPLAAAMAVLNLIFAAGLLLMLAGNTDDLVFALPPSLKILLTLPLVALPLTLAVVYCAARMWREACDWSAYDRIQYSLIALAAVAFVWWLNFWNLLGYKFG